MEPRALIDFLKVLEQMKCNTRHSWTTSGRQESVAEHSWRLAVLAMLVGKEFPELDMNKVIKMSLIHDWGEAVTGDIPAFEKTDTDEEVERDAISTLVKQLPPALAEEIGGLFREMDECRSGEAMLCKALDKLETLIQHNEAGAGTWLPLEFDMNLVYGNEIAKEFPYTRRLRKLVREDTLDIIERYEKGER